MTQGRQRLDKWLWRARFAKSRTLAARLVTDGFVRLNGARITSAARPVGPGDVLTIAAPHRTATIRILAAGDRRGPAPEARGLYQDLAPPESAGASRLCGRDDGPLVTGEPDH